jgi:HSP20 family protein
MADESSPRNKRPKSVDLETDMEEIVRRWVIVNHATIWHPPTDVYELDGRLIVVVEVAGMRDGDFSVTLQGQLLTISGVRQRVAAPDCAYHQLEIRFGEFRTEVNLPWSVAREDVVATYQDGLLRVELPRAPKQKVQIVNVDTEESES